MSGVAQPHDNAIASASGSSSPRTLPDLERPPQSDEHSRHSGGLDARNPQPEYHDDEGAEVGNHEFPPRPTASARPRPVPHGLRSASQMFRRRRPEEIRYMAKAERIKTRDELWKRGIVVVALILSWFFFSMLISVYNKWMFDPEKRNLPYPIFVTSLHMAVQFSIAAMLLAVFDRTGRIELLPRNKETEQRRRPSGQDWMTKVFPCALATALDIGLSNSSLKSISLTLYTMCKSSNLVFVLLFAFLFRLEKLRWNLVAVIVVITIGVIMMVSAETKLVVLGAIQVLLASCMGGLRWALTQMLLEKEKLGMNNPVATIFWLCPPMAVLLLTTSGVVESWSDLFASDDFHGGLGRLLKTVSLLIFPGILAFCMSLSEYALIQRTSVVTLSVAGILKEVLTVIVASIVFDDRLTPVNITGLCIAVSGIAAYNWIKYRSLRDKAEGDDERSSKPDNQRGGYQQVSSNSRRDVIWDHNDDRSDASDDDEERVLFGESAATSAAQFHIGEDDDAVDRNTQHPLSVSENRPKSAAQRLQAEEEERQRAKRREEADLDGWNSSGFQVSSDGYFDDKEAR
ncbi:unnamed protein product [Jaminaea pallidilutea]